MTSPLEYIQATDQEKVDYVEINGQILSSSIKVDLSMDEFLYVQKALLRTHKNRVYVRKYFQKRREQENASEDNCNRLSYLLYINDREAMEPGNDHINISCQLTSTGRVILDLTVEEFTYIKESLQRLYNDRNRYRKVAQERRSTKTATLRQVKRKKAVLFKLN